jgi:hypothetical protein
MRGDPNRDASHAAACVQAADLVAWLLDEAEADRL